LFFPNTVEAYLDDGDYTQLREIQKVEIASKTYSIYSKPGVYGWKKIDVGTSYLIEELSKLFQGKSLAFDTSPELSERFIQACYRLLNKGGHAYFVTNAFVNIEKTISMLKLDSHIIGNNKQFKITCIRHRDAQASKKR